MRLIWAITITVLVALSLWFGTETLESKPALYKGGHVLPGGGYASSFITAAGANFTAFEGQPDIWRFVRDSGFPDREWRLGVYDCIIKDGNDYFGFALDFCAYAKTQNRLFIPFGEYEKGQDYWHLFTITFVGNKVYGADPLYGRVWLTNYTVD